MLAKNVAEWCSESFFTIMEKSVLEVLTLATIISEQVDIEMMNIQNKSNG